MFRIGEFSRLTQVSIRMLRHYDEAGLLHPARVDPLTGYRLYTVEQMPKLQRIVLLRDMGFTVAQMPELIADWDEAALARRLEGKRLEAKQAIAREQARIREIQAALADIRSNALDVCCNVTMKRVEGFCVLSLRRTIARYDCESELWRDLYAHIERERIALGAAHGNVAFFYDEEHREADVDVEVCVVVDRPGENKGAFTYRRIEPVVRMASILVYGPYDGIGAAYRSFALWLSRHEQYAMDGPTRQICHKGPWDEDDPAGYLTELQVPLREIGEKGLDSDTM